MDNDNEKVARDLGDYNEVARLIGRAILGVLGGYYVVIGWVFRVMFWGGLVAWALLGVMFLYHLLVAIL